MPPLAKQSFSTQIEYVRLADAYQHIGKVEFGERWIDHEIGISLKRHPKAISLASPDFIQPRQKRIIEPQYHRLISASLKNAPIVSLNREGVMGSHPAFLGGQQ